MSELSSDEEIDDVLDEEIDDILEHHFDLESDNTENNPSFFRQSVLSNLYIIKLNETSKLHLLEPNLAVNSYRRNSYLGLFHLFLPMATLNSYRAYSNVKLAEEGPNKQANTAEFMAYIGLELATSLIPLVSQCMLNYANPNTNHSLYRNN